MWKQIMELITSSYTNEKRTRLVMFNLLNILLAIVSLTMTVVNLQTKEIELMATTAAFSFLCLLNYVFIKTHWFKTSVTVALCTVKAMILLVYLVLSGIPAGFSVLWTLLVPAISLYGLGRQVGIRFSLLTLSPTFMLRFPFVHVCLFVAAL